MWLFFNDCLRVSGGHWNVFVLFSVIMLIMVIAIVWYENLDFVEVLSRLYWC